MNEYKIYGGLKYLIHDETKPVFKFISYQKEKKTKRKKKCRKRTRKRNRHN